MRRPVPHRPASAPARSPCLGQAHPAARRAASPHPRRAAHEFGAFVAEGNASAAGFLVSRAELPYKAFNEAAIIVRNVADPGGEAPDTDDEWRPSTSSTSLDLERPSGAGAPCDSNERAQSLRGAGDAEDRGH